MSNGVFKLSRYSAVGSAPNFKKYLNENYDSFPDQQWKCQHFPTKLWVYSEGANANVLYAPCHMTDGQSLSTSIETGGISNVDGVLTK